MIGGHLRAFARAIASLHANGRRRGRDDACERGQAMVEFALIAPVFILLIAGVIQFAVGLNYWLDLQRIANQGARWAVVDAYPNCPPTGPKAPCNPTLQQYLASEPVAGGLNPEEVYICFPPDPTDPAGPVTIGRPVTVRLREEFTFVPIIGVGTINLKGAATMRLEQTPTRYLADGAC